MSKSSEKEEKAAFEAWDYFEKMNPAAQAYAWRGWEARAALAVPAASLGEARDSVTADLLAALEEARAGLLWYRDMHPESADGSDDETLERIDAAILAAL
jgi:hypothetical protein